MTVSLVACTADPPDSDSDISDLAGAPSCSTTPTLIDHSLAVTDPTVLSHFSFQRTMQRILRSSGATGESTKHLYQQWMSTFGPTDCTNPKIDPNHYGEKCPRADEFELASQDPTDPNSPVQFVPLGVFNRFDLAPKNGANCGEYRIIYAMTFNAVVAGRALYIFEATLPNPSPTHDPAGCLPIAEFWQRLSKLTDFARIGNQLDRFYYGGTAIAGVGPVVDAANYGLSSNGGVHGSGQIRSNMFINFFQWHLREFKTSIVCSGPSCTLTLDHVTAKTNPANELFDGTAAKSPAFLAAFPTQVKALSSMDISTIGMSIANSFNEFESVSQLVSGGGLDNDVLYDQHADAKLTEAVQQQLTSIGSTLTPTDIFRRATTQTCGGCHQQSSGAEAELGGFNSDGTPFTWPQSVGFVHLSEDGTLSNALTQFFLPHRMGVLDDFIASHCSGATAIVDDGLTLGGSPVGAAN